jgi:hypothetical protein
LKGGRDRSDRVELSFSADGRTLHAAGQSWDVASGREREEPEALREAPGLNPKGWKMVDEKNRRLSFLGGRALSPDGKLLAAGFENEESRKGRDPGPTETVGLWEVKTGRLVRSLRQTRVGPPSSIAFSPDGERLATSGSPYDPPQLWDVATGRAVCKFTRPEDDPRRGKAFAPMVFSPDGALLAMSGEDGVVDLWETATGGAVLVLRGHARPVRALAFAPDGRRLISGGADGTALVWSVAPADLPEKWDADRANGLWEKLAGEPAAAYRAVSALAAAPDRAIPFLKERLRPEEELDARQVARWVTALGDDEFKVREEATRRLRDLGERAAPALRKALAGQEDLERRRRLDGLLSDLDGLTPSPAQLRNWRAVQALEQMGTPAAEILLEALARGTDDGTTTRAARAALRRLKERREPGRPGDR